MDAHPETIRVGGWILTPDPDAATRNPGTRLEHAEALRRFAQARTLAALTDLHDHAQRTMPRHLADLETDPGMGISARAGTLVTRLGLEAAVEQVSLVFGVAPHAAAHALHRAETLAADLPEVLDALAEGRLGAAHAEVIADQAARITARPVPAPDTRDPAATGARDRAVAAEERAARAARTELGRRLLDYAPGRNPAAVRAKARRLLEGYDPASFTRRTREAVEGRYFRVDPGADGMAYLSVSLQAAKAEAIYDRVHAQAKLLKDTAAPATGPGAGGADEREGRTMDQLRTDVFADHMLAGPRGSGLENVAAHVSITVPANLLPGLDPARGTARAPATAPPTPAAGPVATGRGTGCPAGPACTCAAGPGARAADPVPRPGADVPRTRRLGAIDQDSATALMAGAPSWWRILTDPFGGAIIDWAHDRYRPTPAQRRALAHRDQTCRTPGCDRPAPSCEPDHTVEWREGGTTSLDNLALLCKRCHRLKSLGLLSMRQLPDGTVLATTLWGTTASTRPEAPWAVPGRTTPTTGAAAGTAAAVQSGAGAPAVQSGAAIVQAGATAAGPVPAVPEGNPCGDPADHAWEDFWDDPAPQPPPETVERLNAALFAWADEHLETPPPDPAAAAAACVAHFEALEAEAVLEAERAADRRAYEAAGGHDIPWLMAELAQLDHTPARDPGLPRPRPAAPPAQARRPRIKAMRKRLPVPTPTTSPGIPGAGTRAVQGAGAGAGTGGGKGTAAGQGVGAVPPRPDPWAAWTAPSAFDPNTPEPPF